MAEPETIAVVTVNWNGWRNTLQCLDALRMSQGPCWRLYVVDNASTDSSLARLSNLGAEVTLITSKINGGWTGGNNLGIAAALQAGHPFIFILNNDAFVRSDTLAVLLDRAAFEAFEGKPAVLGPIHKGIGSDSYSFFAAAFDPETGIPEWVPPERFDEKRAPEYWSTAYISGAGIFAHRIHFIEVGLFDDRFYLNFDDTDWCVRAARMGFPLLIIRASALQHIGSASIGGRASPLQTYFLTRNRLLFAEQHCTVTQRLKLCRQYYRRARDLMPKRKGWLSQLIVAKDGPPAAFRAGVIDYLLRRFGDCPPAVRELKP